MPDANDWGFDACRERLRDATRVIITAEDAYKKAIERSADAEAVYRNQLANHYQRHRKEGGAVQESELLAKADAATLSRERDYAAGVVKLCAEQLEDARDSRRSLWRLVEWQRDRDVAQVRAGVDAR